MTLCYVCKTCKEDWTWEWEGEKEISHCPFCGGKEIKRDKELEEQIATM